MFPVSPDHKHCFIGKYGRLQHLKEPFPLPVVYNFVQIQILYSGSVQNAGIALHFPPVLRKQQAKVVKSMLLGKTVLCIMPTASGKTLASISSSIIKAQVSISSFEI
jgi:superfamily II DNA or RNA helicase